MPAGVLGRADPGTSPARSVRFRSAPAPVCWPAGSCSEVSARSGRTPPSQALAPPAVPALATALLPRLGWLMTVFALCAGSSRPRPTARARRSCWRPRPCRSVPASARRPPLVRAVFAPLLGTVALGPAFIGIAALAADRVAPRRARDRGPGGSPSVRRLPARRFSSARRTGRCRGPTGEARSRRPPPPTCFSRSSRRPRWRRSSCGARSPWRCRS